MRHVWFEFASCALSVAAVAQLVEQRIVIPWVVGSIPIRRPNNPKGSNVSGV